MFKTLYTYICHPLLWHILYRKNHKIGLYRKITYFPKFFARNINIWYYTGKDKNIFRHSQKYEIFLFKSHSKARCSDIRMIDQNIWVFQYMTTSLHFDCLPALCLLFFTLHFGEPRRQNWKIWKVCFNRLFSIV